MQASQDVPATSTAAHTLLLLTEGPKFDKTVSQAIFESAKSSATHTNKLLSEKLALTPTHAFPSANKIQMDLLLANQQTIMANQ